MTLREFASELFGYRIHNGDNAWEAAAQVLSKNGTWSSAKKQERLFIEVLKRVEKLEEHVDGSTDRKEVVQPSDK